MGTHFVSTENLSTLPSSFRLGDKVVETERNMICAEGADIQLEPKIMDVLKTLASHQGEVVSRADLIDEIWQVEFGADESLTRAISQLRKALGDKRGAPKYIETISKRGYRLIQKVESIEPTSKTTSSSSAEDAQDAADAESNDRAERAPNVLPPEAAYSPAKGARQKALIAISVFAIIAAFFGTLSTFQNTAGKKVIANDSAMAEEALGGPVNTGVETPAAPTNKAVAVLPFTALSSGVDDNYFADGLTEELLVTLGRAPDLSVTARESSFRFKKSETPDKEVGEMLGVEYLVRGTVRRDGDNVRITARLINSKTDAQKWSQSYDRTMNDVFAIQQDIAENITAALEIVLDNNARTAMANAGLRDVEAFIAYQKGQEFYISAHKTGHRSLMPDLRQADAYFAEAIARTPGFANAWALRVDLQYHLLNGFSHRRDEEPGLAPTEDELVNALPRMREYLNKAYENAPDEKMRAQFDAERTFFSDNWSNLAVKLDRFLMHADCFGQSWVFEAAPVVGRADAALAASKRYLSCAPIDPGGYYYGVNSALWSGDTQQARRFLVAYMSHFNENFAMILNKWLTVSLMEDNLAEAEELNTRFEGNMHNANAVMLAAFAGDKQHAEEMYAKLLEGFPGNDDIKIVMGNAIIGNREEANRLAAKVDARPAGPALLLTMTQSCHCGAPFDLEATPNFAARMEEAGFQWPPKKLIDFPLKEW